MSLRHQGFDGVIYSVEPRAAAYEALLANARGDPNWFPLPRQEAGAAQGYTTPGATSTGSERIFVNQSAHLLREDAMRSILAVKVDVRGQEAGAVEGYQPLIDGVRLLFLEQPGSSVGRPEPSDGACEDWLPRYRVYDRAARALGAPRYDRGVRIDAVVTSVGGTLERRLPNGEDLGPLWLQSCVQSWRQLGSPVLSVSERAPPAGIRWIRTDARPSIAQILSAAAPAVSSHLLLTNADIVFTEALAALLPSLHGRAVYYGSRLDVERTTGAAAGLTVRGTYGLGFDYFLLPAAFVSAIVEQQLLPEGLRVGEPWWDYLLPLLALARGFPLKKLGGGPPLALHYVHPTRYAESLWIRNRDIFLSQVVRLQREPHCHATGLLAEILAGGGPIPHLICRRLP